MKRLFADRGWLGKTVSMHELPNREHRKIGIKNIGGKFFKSVGTFVRGFTIACFVTNNV